MNEIATITHFLMNLLKDVAGSLKKVIKDRNCKNGLSIMDLALFYH